MNTIEYYKYLPASLLPQKQWIKIRKIAHTGLLVCIAMLAGCALTPRAFHDSDANQDFTNYQQFSWIDETQENSDSRTNPLVAKRIRVAIETNLTNQGYVQIDDKSAADFLVSFTLGAKDRIQVSSLPGHSIFRNKKRGIYFVESELLTDNYTEGSFAIDIFDVLSDSPVWHGTISKRLNAAERNGVVSEKTINAWVAELLSHFPPG